MSEYLWVGGGGREDKDDPSVPLLPYESSVSVKEKETKKVYFSS